MATAPRLSRAEARARTRARLLDAAGEVFAEKGYLAATIEEISDRAGFTRGAFYANFAGKADILLTLLEEEYASIFGEVVERIETAPEDEKLASAQAWYERVTSGHTLDRAINEVWPEAVQDPDLRTRLARREAVARTAIAEMVAAFARGAGIELPIPAEQVAAIGLAIGEGLASQRRLDPDAVPAELFGIAQMWMWNGMSATAR